MTKNIMEYSNILPEGYDGTFRFTNWTDEDFVGKWGSKEYHFPAQTTSPILIDNETPLGIQQIRKKFARDLANREFPKTDAYGNYMKQERNPDGSPRLNSIHQAGSWSIDQLAPLIQKCLEPLTLVKASVTEAMVMPMEDKLSRDNSGELNTHVLSEGEDLIESKKKLRRKALGE